MKSSLRVWLFTIGFVAAELFAVLTAAALPWSTTVFAILLIPFCVAVGASVDATSRHALCSAPSLVAIALVLLALCGMLWSEATLAESIHMMTRIVKFLALPVLLYHFARSKRGAWVLSSFLFSCCVLMIYSWIITLEPTWALKTGRCCGEDYGVPVRNYLDQSQEFAICFVGSISAALYCFEANLRRRAIVLCAVAALFAANLVFVVTSRTAVFCIPVMLVVVAWRHVSRRNVLTVLCAGAILVVAMWFASPHLRTRVESLQSQFLEYRDADVPSSVGKRLEFWHKSIRFFGEAPIIGHGTGSTEKLFRDDAVGRSGTAAVIVADPHNQTLSVAIQWGVLGLTALYALWLVHLRTFLRAGLIAELGLLVIVQNVVGCLFNSHLFDFTEGWLYVLGVGVMAGMTTLDRIPEQHKVRVSLAGAR